MLGNELVPARAETLVGCDPLATFQALGVQ